MWLTGAFYCAAVKIATRLVAVRYGRWREHPKLSRRHATCSNVGRLSGDTRGEPVRDLRRLTLATTATVLCLSFDAQADTFTFANITHNSIVDATIGESQLFVDVTAAPGDPTKAVFTFRNVGPQASSICDIYFDDGPILGIASVDNGSGVDFEQEATPRDLPGGNALSPPFETTKDFSAQSTPPVQPNGVNPGESVAITFDLENGATFDDVLDALQDGTLRIGIHVQGFADGDSESFVNSPGPLQRVPEPVSAMAGLLGVAALLWRRRNSG